LVNLETADEERLIEQARQGDRSAYAELARRHYPGVIQVIYRMCGDAELAQDAAQDAFLRAWQSLASFRPRSEQPNAFRSWLYRIAVNAALDTLRRGKHTANVELESLPLADPQDDPESALIHKQRSELVRTAILSLSEASRAALVLREYGGLSYAEIAQALDIPTGTVMSRLSFARQQLKEALRAHLPELEGTHD
jgi:RNA polymerase sigma-70 factor (ECF subfamily)